jgi:chromosome segregation ATPase
MSKGYDIGSARTMLSFLGRATQHWEERQHARKKLKIELSRLKKISTHSMKGYMQKLEHSITEAINKEQRILKHQSKDDIFHGDVRAQIQELEARLAHYMTIHEARAERVKLLETALTTETESKAEQLGAIRQSLNKIERIHKSLAKNKKHPKKQLAKIKKVIDKIKEKVRKAEKKL